MWWSTLFSNKISRVSPYSFQLSLIVISTTGVSPTTPGFPKTIRLLRSRYVADLGSSNFARHYSQNRFCFLFLFLLRYFNSEGVAYLTVYIVFNYVGFPIRIPADLRSLTTPRSVSPFVASFIAF